MFKSQLEAERQYRQRINDYTIEGLLATIAFAIGIPFAIMFFISFF